MNKQVKGLLKGLRYISQVFDGEKEQEMQIGFPTDVKHVAHIGWDGPSAAAAAPPPTNNPAWMNGFHSAPLTTSFGQDGREVANSPKSASQEIPLSGNPPDSLPPESPNSKPHRRSRRHASSSESPGSGSAPPTGSESPARGSSRHSRRHQSVGSAPGSESAEGSRRGGSRRSSKSLASESANGSETAPGSESPARDLPSIPKQSRRRKTKVGSDDGSTRSSTRSKNPSFSDVDPDPEGGSTRPVQTLETVVEGEI